MEKLEVKYLDKYFDVKRLIEEGDEKETRQAWLEEIADRAKCPVCGSGLYVKKMRIKCESASSHVSWP